MDAYANGVLAGRLYDLCFPEGRPFSGVTQLLLEMGATLEGRETFPTFAAAPAFSGAGRGKMEKLPEGDAQTGALATFAVRLIFRQNASWQGSITWLEGEVEQSFRSVLELILLMDSALAESGRETAGPPRRTEAAAAP